MNPGIYNLSFVQGDSEHWQFFLWLDADRTRPVDLADVKVEAVIGNTKLHCEVTLPNIVLVSLPAADSAELSPHCRWALKLVAGEEVQTVLRGQVWLTESVLA